MDWHSAAAQSAYIDLRRLAMDEAAADIRGTIETRERNGRRYLYERRRIGSDVIARYLGEDSEPLQDRIARAEALRLQARERRDTRTRLVRLLRAEGYRSVDRATGSLLAAFANAGLFRLGGTLVGTVAFSLYEGELGVRLSRDDIAQTGDIDIASFERLSVCLDDRVTETPGDILARMDFAPVPGVFDRQVWRWTQSASETEVEFLTAAFGNERVTPLPALGVSAQALNYLEFLIAEPIQAVALYRSGVLVQIPRPERFALHKLIVADRRRDGDGNLKSRKDRAQAEFLIDVLAEDRPDELLDAWEDAKGRGPKWRGRLDATLDRMPRTREVLEGL